PRVLFLDDKFVDEDDCDQGECELELFRHRLQ
ncbi:MAG: hypothetical protein ACI8XM_001357, partial [Haloarculaceae archaeon]